jgi:hypothetical protein
VEQVDCGDPDGPRTIVSGLVKYCSLEEMQGRAVIVLANLKVPLRGAAAAARGRARGAWRHPFMRARGRHCGSRDLGP